MKYRIPDNREVVDLGDPNDPWRRYMSAMLKWSMEPISPADLQKAAHQKEGGAVAKKSKPKTGGGAMLKEEIKTPLPLERKRRFTVLLEGTLEVQPKEFPFGRETGPASQAIPIKPEE